MSARERRCLLLYYHIREAEPPSSDISNSETTLLSHLAPPASEAELPDCRGIVTADVLVQGLSHGAIAARKLKGVKRDKGHEDYTGSAPYVQGKSLLQLRWYCSGFR